MPKRLFNPEVRRDPRQCEGKTPYNSERKAMVGVRFLRDHGERVRPYPCRLCGKWHLAH